MSAAIDSARVDDARLAGLISRGAATLALPLAESQVDRLVAFVRLIARWNVTYNLTAVRDPMDMAVRHILDCLAAAAALLRRQGSGEGERLLDVGSGAGLPGVVIAIASTERDVVCVDSVAKKTAFITHVAGALGITNVSAVHGRVESMAHAPFHVISSRAFSTLGDFVAATRQLMKPGGTWMAMKGRMPADELAGLQGLTFHVEPLEVPGLNAERCLVWIDSSTEASARL